MKRKENMNRRTMLKAAGAAGIGLAAIGSSAEAEEKRSKRTPPSFKNADFYDAGGKFNVEAGKDALIKLMKYHRYPIFKDVRENLWVSDYGLGEFTKVGLGARIFLNDQEGGYLGLDIYLLPNQMLPEHYHVETEKAPAKLEGWVVRHGLSYVYGEGEPTRNIKAAIPESQKDHVTVRHETILRPGESCKINRKTERHWQFAGPEGAILSELGSFHDNDAVRHSNPKIVFP